jgi:hypothetical protein
MEEIEKRLENKFVELQKEFEDLRKQIEQETAKKVIYTEL